MANKVSFIIQLKDQFGKTAQSVSKQFANIDKSAKNAHKSVKKFTKDSEKNLESLKKSAGKTGAILTASLTLPIGLAGRAMVQAGSDAVETANKFNNVFDDVSVKANKTADQFAKSFGTAGSTARKLIGDTGDLLVGFGFAGDQALELSSQVNELAADLTSFQNVPGGVKQASEALTKALLGETESAKSLGIVVRQNTDEFKNQVKALVKTKGMTEQQAKAIVILKQAQEQSRKAIGDTARTWNDYASVARRSDEASKEMAESFGKLLLPIATDLMIAVTDLANWLNSLSPAMKKTIMVVAGLLAVMGPLLLVVKAFIVAAPVLAVVFKGLALAGGLVLTVMKGIGIALAAVSLPVAAVIAGVVALGAAITAVFMNWDSIVAKFAEWWPMLKSKMADFVNFAIRILNTMLAPLNMVVEALGMGGVQISPIGSPETPVASVNGSVDGTITVEASPGTEVKKTSMSSSSPLGGMSVGMNMVTSNG